MLSCVLRDTCTGFARIAPICHRRLRPPSSCTKAAFWRDTFEAAPRWRRGWGRGWNLSRREQRKNLQLLESIFPTCCCQLVPLRFVIVFPCGFNFSAGPWAITPESLPTGRCLKKMTISCCRVIFVVASLITPPWLTCVVMNLERGHEGAS